MKKRKFLSGLLVSFLVFALAACNQQAGGGSGADGGAGADDDQLVFGYTSMTQNNPFFIVLEESIRKEVEANGDKLITMNPAMDVALQINQIEDMIAQGIDGIFLNPVDWEGIRPALVMLEEAGIPIINYDTEVKDFEYVTAYVGSDNKNAGRVVGEDLVKRFPDGGKIAVLDSPTMNSINDRVAGFMEAIEGANFEIVAQQDGKGDLETSLGITEDILQAHPDIIAIFGGNDPSALGALAAVKAANRDDIAIYGVDGSPDAKAAIAEGGPFKGSGAQSPISIGKESVKVAYKILNKEQFEERTPVETFLINKDNVEQYGTDGWQ
jgi:ribose transport system substrate-binding protein